MQLIEVFKNSKGEQIVNARDLFNFLNIHEDFFKWIKKRIKEYDFVENQDFIIDSNNKYLLTIDTAKELAIVEKSSSGKIARKYFISCEKKYREKEAIKYILHQNATVREYATSIMYLINQARTVGELKGNKLEELFNICIRLKAHAFPYVTDSKYKVTDNRIIY